MTTTQTARKRAMYAVPAINPMEDGVSSAPSRQAATAGHPLATMMRLREDAAAEVDRLLAFLDATEGDIDLEDFSDAEVCCEDEGGQCEDEGAVFDDEPSLGSLVCLAMAAVQDHWADGNTDDREDEHDGREPSLCGITAGGPFCDDLDREEACEDEGALDSGIADLDGLMEQCPATFEGHDQRVLA